MCRLWLRALPLLRPLLIQLLLLLRRRHCCRRLRSRTPACRGIPAVQRPTRCLPQGAQIQRRLPLASEMTTCLIHQ